MTSKNVCLQTKEDDQNVIKWAERSIVLDNYNVAILFRLIMHRILLTVVELSQ